MIQANRYNALHWRVVSDTAAEDLSHSPPIAAEKLNVRRVMWYDASWRLIQEDVFQAPFTGTGGAQVSLPATTTACSTSWLDRQCHTIYGLRGIDDVIARRVFDGGLEALTAAHGDARGFGAHFYLTDTQGSPLAIVLANGHVSERLDYTSFGVVQHRWPIDLTGKNEANPDLLGDFITRYFDLAAVQATTTTSGYSLHIDYNGSGTMDPDDLGDFITDYFAVTESPYDALPDGHLTVEDDHGGKSLGLADNIFGWCGYVYNQSTQQYTVRYRHYDPKLGRWLERDPAGFVDSMNLYGYGWGNPTGATDPFGLFSWQTSGLGVPKAIGGVAEIATGVVIGVTVGWTGVGAVGAGMVIAMGFDNIVAGVRQAVSGEERHGLITQMVGALVKLVTGNSTLGDNAVAATELIEGLVDLAIAVALAPVTGGGSLALAGAEGELIIAKVAAVVGSTVTTQEMIAALAGIVHAVVGAAGESGKSEGGGGSETGSGKSGGCSGGRQKEPVGDPAPPKYKKYHPGKPVEDHIEARAGGGSATDPANRRTIPWEMNARKDGYEGQLLRYERELVRLGLTPEQARKVTQPEWDALKRDAIPRPIDPDILDLLHVPGS